MAQAIFDLLLFVMVLLLFFQVRRLRNLPLDEIIKRLEAANSLCERLSKNLSEKKELSERLISALETGASAWENSRKDASSLRSKVLSLAQKGLSTAEIAKKTGLQEGEVALILSVAGKKRS
ncbi:MAG: hypothetical protein GXO20_00440 [Thermodesulfobacteria bacterium]|nr:hypothetical protein [Thermodesulfobacteriota bacterium]